MSIFHSYITVYQRVIIWSCFFFPGFFWFFIGLFFPHFFQRKSMLVGSTDSAENYISDARTDGFWFWYVTLFQPNVKGMVGPVKWLGNWSSATTLDQKLLSEEILVELWGSRWYFHVSGRGNQRWPCPSKQCQAQRSTGHQAAQHSTAGTWKTWKCSRCSWAGSFPRWSSPWCADPADSSCVSQNWMNMQGNPWFDGKN